MVEPKRLTRHECAQRARDARGWVTTFAEHARLHDTPPSYVNGTLLAQLAEAIEKLLAGEVDK